MKAEEILLEVLQQEKITKNDKIISFTTTYNPNNPNSFSIIEQSFNSFQYSITMSNIFQKKKLTNYIRHITLEGYSADVNLNHDTKIAK